MAFYSLSLLGLIIFISGCTEDSYRDQEVEQTASPDTITLNVVQSLANPHRTAHLHTLIDEFEAQHPSIRIELITPEYVGADQTILSMLEKKDMIDIVEVRDITVHDYASRGLILNLEPFVSKWHDYELLSHNTTLLSRDVENTAYYIPSSLFQMQLYYRKDWFDAQALQVPETWDEVYLIGKQLTKPEIGQYGFAFRGGKGAANALTQIIQDYNGDQVNRSDSMFRLDGETIFSYAGASNALSVYRKINTEISSPDSLEWGFNEQVAAFADGKAAMLIQNSNAIKMIEGKLPAEAWATAPLPAGPEGVSHFSVGAAGWGIVSHSPYPEEAWTFITFLSSYTNNMSYAKATGVIPIYGNALESEQFKLSPYIPYILMANNPLRYHGVKKPSQYPNYSTYYQMGTERGRLFLQGGMTAKELLQELDAFWLKQTKPAIR